MHRVLKAATKIKIWWRLLNETAECIYNRKKMVTVKSELLTIATGPT